MPKTSAYQRPYKSRGQRREDARKQHDESKDHKFLFQVIAAISVVIVLAVAFALKGMADRSNAEQQATGEYR